LNKANGNIMLNPKSDPSTSLGTRIRNPKIIILSFLISISILGLWTSAAQAKEYDGIWFLGMNLKSEVLKHRNVRKAVEYAVDKEYIAKKIVSEEVVPVGFVPFGMLGYDPDLEMRFQDFKTAKELMKKAGFSMNDQRIKDLSLLHTDGLMTIEIARKVQSDLRNIGMKVDLVEVSYQNEDKWVKELTSGEHEFFLLGYKAGIEQLFTTEAIAQIDSQSLVEPLFKTGGDANFTGYSNAEVDKLLAQLKGINIALKNERHLKLKKVNQQLYQDLPAVVLFYIEKM